ncbi:MAG: nitroreductase family protein [Thermacetogeniaceae bacterium]
MDALEAILTRRSIRRYPAEPVAEDLIKKLLEAAMYAPSAHNQQPWQFIVIQDRQLLDKIPEFHPYSSMLKSAPLAILVCGDSSRFKSSYFWPQDCAAATQNILLAARALGLGTVWMGVYPKENLMEGLRTLFKIPEEIIPFSLIAVGYPAEEKLKPERFDEQRIHYNGW